MGLVVCESNLTWFLDPVSVILSVNETAAGLYSLILPKKEKLDPESKNGFLKDIQKIDKKYYILIMSHRMIMLIWTLLDSCKFHVVRSLLFYLYM